jgi:hypothetical protein
MAVYFFTLHAYRSWSPDHHRGYVRRDEGILPPDPEMAEAYDELARQEPVEFTKQIQDVMIAGAYDICQRRHWRLHAVAFELSHLHLLFSWKEFIEWLEVRAKLKNLLSLFLGRMHGEQGINWFSDGGSRKRVHDRKHFNYLIETYIPKQSEAKWYEGDPLPSIPDYILNPPKGNP